VPVRLCFAYSESGMLCSSDKNLENGVTKGITVRCRSRSSKEYRESEYMARIECKDTSIMSGISGQNW